MPRSTPVPARITLSGKDSSVLHIAVPLAIGLGLVVLSVRTAVAAVHVSDTRVDGATVRVRVARRRAWADPNEAAWAVGCWG